MITKSSLLARRAALIEELENRHRFGAVKMADAKGKAISTENLQNELFALTLKISRMED